MDITIDPTFHPLRGKYAAIIQWIETTGELKRERFDSDSEKAVKEFFQWRFSLIGLDIPAFRLAWFTKSEKGYEMYGFEGMEANEIKNRIGREIIEKIGADLEEGQEDFA